MSHSVPSAASRCDRAPLPDRPDRHACGRHRRRVVVPHRPEASGERGRRGARRSPELPQSKAAAETRRSPEQIRTTAASRRRTSSFAPPSSPTTRSRRPTAGTGYFLRQALRSRLSRGARQGGSPCRCDEPRRWAACNRLAPREAPAASPSPAGETRPNSTSRRWGRAPSADEHRCSYGGMGPTDIGAWIREGLDAWMDNNRWYYRPPA